MDFNTHVTAKLVEMKEHIVVGLTILPMCIFIDFGFLVLFDSEFQAALIYNTYFVEK